MTSIITKSSSDELAACIAEFTSSSPAKLIRMEGICGSGKTTIARKLAANGVGLHIEVDKFAIQQPKDTPYLDCLRREELDAAIERAIRSDKIVILDAVCLGDVAPIERWGRGISIYVKRLSFNSVDPVWHAGFNLEDDPPSNEPHRSVHHYHLTHEPHMKADLIVEFPDDGHRFWRVPFSRERCFDPPNSVVVA
jgi:hypothetical protein